jgi:hypothetical protein
VSFPTPPPEDNPFAPPPEGGSVPLPPVPPPPPPPFSGTPAAPPPPPAPSYGSPPPPAYGTPSPPPPAYGTPAPYGAPGYGTPTYGQAYAAPENGQGTTALVTGILGLLCCGLLSIVAIVTGRKGMALADSGRASNRGSAQAGMILGWIGVALWIVGVAFAIIGVIAGSTSTSTSVGAG